MFSNRLIVRLVFALLVLYGSNSFSVVAPLCGNIFQNNSDKNENKNQIDKSPDSLIAEMAHSARKAEEVGSHRAKQLVDTWINDLNLNHRNNEQVTNEALSHFLANLIAAINNANFNGHQMRSYANEDIYVSSLLNYVHDFFSNRFFLTFDQFLLIYQTLSEIQRIKPNMHQTLIRFKTLQWGKAREPGVQKLMEEILSKNNFYQNKWNEEVLADRVWQSIRELSSKEARLQAFFLAMLSVSFLRDEGLYYIRLVDHYLTFLDNAYYEEAQGNKKLVQSQIVSEAKAVQEIINIARFNKASQPGIGVLLEGLHHLVNNSPVFYN
ncbi:MAG: hypothetical protein NZ480_03025 [Bdellovibrionaceae bacterium]|nr:hypothetical protein [Pseudobdellovibrionaceae bacterium]MDW8190282.1 hypothetical protein [Pseudobdellovibrionaceae bacterium]